MKQCFLISAFIVLVMLSVPTQAQFSSSYTGAWSTTWNNPTSSLASVVIQGYINKKMLERSIANQKAGKGGGSKPAVGSRSPSAISTTAGPPSSTVDHGVLKFKPVADSGVAKRTADLIGTTAAERAALLRIFEEIKRAYETEVAKDGQSNDVAAALTFFMTATSMAYHQTDDPAETITSTLFEVLQQEISAAADFKKMTSLEKQKMHDWLVVAGGFVLAGYMDGLQKNDQKQLGDYKQLADEFFKIVLGTSAAKFNLTTMGKQPAG
jgi:hypothetical protein